MSDVASRVGMTGAFQDYARKTAKAGKVNKNTREAIVQRNQKEERIRTHPILMAINANKHYQPRGQGEQTEEEQRREYEDQTKSAESHEKGVDYLV